MGSLKRGLFFLMLMMVFAVRADEKTESRSSYSKDDNSEAVKFPGNSVSSFTLHPPKPVHIIHKDVDFTSSRPIPAYLTQTQRPFNFLESNIKPITKPNEKHSFIQPGFPIRPQQFTLPPPQNLVLPHYPPEPQIHPDFIYEQTKYPIEPQYPIQPPSPHFPVPPQRPTVEPNFPTPPPHHYKPQIPSYRPPIQPQFPHHRPQIPHRPPIQPQFPSPPKRPPLPPQKPTYPTPPIVPSGPRYPDEDGDLTHSIPGIPSKDYPIYAEIPLTDFHCDRIYPGFYADMNAGCQVWHYCQLDGRQDSFLCPNGTMFNQKYFVCDWWYNVDCEASQHFYPLNSNLYREPQHIQEGGHHSRPKPYSPLTHDHESTQNQVSYS